MREVVYLVCLYIPYTLGEGQIQVHSQFHNPMSVYNENYSICGPGVSEVIMLVNYISFFNFRLKGSMGIILKSKLRQVGYCFWGLASFTRSASATTVRTGRLYMM